MSAPAAAQNATWSTDPENVVFGGRSDYQDPDNWVPAQVPTDTATFGPTDETDIFFENQVNQQPIEIGSFVFTPDAPAYIFTLQSDEVTFTGDGIVNNSSSVQNLISGNRSILRFANMSGADDASLLVMGGTGRIFFEDNSSAEDASITVGQADSAGILHFLGSSTAGNATILNNLGSIFFFGSSSAGDADITNHSGLFFHSSGGLGTAHVDNHAGVAIAFGASGADATIVNHDGGTVDVSSNDGTTDTAIGSLSGAGDVLLGSVNLTLGNLDQDDTIGGAIMDGGDLGGTGGGLTKVGSGTLTLSGDSSYTGDTIVNVGTLLLTGSIDGTSQVTVGGGGGTGMLRIEDGATLASTGAAQIGEDGGNGTVTVTGANSAWTLDGELTVGSLVGDGGVGRLNVESGAMVTSAGSSIVFRASLPSTDGRVSVTGAGSVWNSGQLLVLASSSTDLLTISAGGTVNSTLVNLAGSVLATGGGSVWNIEHLIVGPNLSANGNPAGRLTIADGAIVNSDSAVIGEGGSFTSAVTIDGAGSAWNTGSDLVISPTEFRSGQVTVRNGGELTVVGGTGTIFVGPNGGTSFLSIGGGAPGTLPGTVNAALVEIGAGSFLSFEHAAADYLFAPTIAGSGRVLFGSGTTILTANSTSFTGTTTIFNGAELRLGNGVSSGSGVIIDQPGPTGAIGGDIVNDGALVIYRTGTLALDGVISGTGTLRQRGTVTTTVTAENSYTGATTIDGGTLLVNGSIASSSLVRVNGGGTLGGTGTVASTTADGGGTLTPGASIGTLNIDGDLTLGAVNYQAEVGSASADLLDVTESASLGGRLVAIASGDGYAPGQYVLLDAADGLSGTFTTFATFGNFDGLAASLSYDANKVYLNLATFVDSGQERWLPDPATNNWNTGTNWNPSSVPAATARFGPSTRTTVDFSPGTTQIGRLLFDEDAPAYTFRLDTGLVRLGGGDILNILGEGIVNHSAFRPTILLAGHDVSARGGGALNFMNSSTAGNAYISSFSASGIVAGATTFYDTSSAADAIIDSTGEGAAFRDSSTAGNATINNGAAGPGGTAFFDTSSAGNATINNLLDLGGVLFLDSSTAASAEIVNHATAGLRFGRSDLVIAGVTFADSSSAGSASIFNEDGSTAFYGTSSAGDATIVNSAASPGSFFFSTLFAEDSSAGSATITNNQGGVTLFEDQASAANATIVNNPGGSSQFFQTGSAGTPTITNGDGGSVRFRLTAQGGDATIVNQQGGVVDISEDPEQTPALVADSVAIGSLSGAGDVFLGARTLVLGGLDRDETIGGVIADGGEFGGAGGALTKAGDGTLILTENNSYTGGTTIESGVLQLGSGGARGAVVGDVSNDAALVIHRRGTLTLAGTISGDGTLTQNGSVQTTLSGNNSYTGATTINGGTLLVTGSIATSDLTINDGATLGGTGTVGDTELADGATIAPGLSIGTLHVDGDIVFGNTNYLAEVSPTAADLIDVTGTATLDGILTAIALGGSYSPGQYTLLSAEAGRSGTFDDLQTQGSFSGLSAMLSYDANNVILTLAAAVGAPDWTGEVSTNWFINGNWDNDAVPTADDDVTINTVTPNPTVIAAAGAVSDDIAIGTAGGTGNLTIRDGGTLATGGSAVIGDGAGVGEVRVTGTGSRWTIAGSLVLAGTSEGAGTHGTLRIEEGAAVTSNGVMVNQFSSRSSRVVVSGEGTTWDTGDFTATGLGNLSGDLVTIENGAAATSISAEVVSRVLVTGDGTSWTTGPLLIGSASAINPGRLAITDGAEVTSTTAQLGLTPGSSPNAGSRGAIEVSAASWSVADDVTIGTDASNPGSLLIRNGGLVVLDEGAGSALVGPLSQLTIGGSPTAAPGMLDAAEVELGATSLLTFSHNSDGHVFAPEISGGGNIAVTLGTTILTSDNDAFAGTTTIGEVIPQVGRGGVLQLGDGGATGSLGGDIVNDNQLIIDRNGMLTIDGVISGTGSLTQHGTVTTVLSGENSYAGATAVNGGALLVTGSIAASDVTVNAGATLGGTGTVGDTTIAAGGTLAPGTSIGTLNVSGDLTFAADSILHFEAAPASADRIVVTGSAALAGTLDAIDLGGTYMAGQEYEVLTAGGGVSGTFGAVTVQGDFSGLDVKLRYEATNVILVLANPGPKNTATTTFTDAIVFNAPTVTVERISLFETRIIGRLSGGTALFDEIFDAAFDSATVQNAIQSARVAITAAGGPGVFVLVSDPVLVGRMVTSTSTTDSIFTLAGTSDTITTTATFGPATVIIGDRQSCLGAVGALPSATRPVCGEPGGQSFEVEGGSVNFNTNTHTDYFIDEARTDTMTETVAETYELTGTVVPVGTVHAAALSGVYDLAGRLLHRVGQEGGLGPFGEAAPQGSGAFSLTSAGSGGGWAEVYGFRHRADARGGLPAERRDAWGLAGGFSLAAGDGLSLGFGIDHGRLDLDVPGAMETADIELTQLALGARFGSGPFSLALAASYGFGSVDSSRSLIAMSTASYDVDVLGLFAEASYTLEAGAWRLVPKAGIDHVRIETDDFAESGLLGLAVPEHDSDRTRLFAGLEFGRSFALGGGSALDLTGSVRYLAVAGGEERTLPVAFTLAPGTPLVMRGLSERDSALIGAQARLQLSPSLDLYLAYDGRFAGGYDAHGATAGLRLVW